MCAYAGSDTLALGSIRESIEVCHGNSHVGAWRFVDLLIPDHVKSVAEVMRRELSFLICASSSAVGIALFAELPLLVRLSIDDRFVAADVEDEISPPGLEDRKVRETRRVRWQIQVVVFVLGVYNFGGNGSNAGFCAGSLAVR